MTDLVVVLKSLHEWHRGIPHNSALEDKITVHILDALSALGEMICLLPVSTPAGVTAKLIAAREANSGLLEVSDALGDSLDEDLEERVSLA